MDNIYEFQDYLQEFFQGEYEKYLTFNDWKEIVASTRDPLRHDEARRYLERYGDKLKAKSVIVDVELSSKEWAPSLVVEYLWSVRGVLITFRISFEAGKVLRVQVADMLGVSSHFGENYDFSVAFEKGIVIMTALRGD